MPAALRVARLIGRIIRDFGLIEIGSAAVAIPKHLKLLVMLDEETIGGDVVAIDHQAVCAEVAGPAHAGAMIGAPDPGVVDDGVVAVDAQIHLCTADAGTANAEEDVVKRGWILQVRRLASFGTDFHEDGREF